MVKDIVTGSVDWVYLYFVGNGKKIYEILWYTDFSFKTLLIKTVSGMSTLTGLKIKL